MIVNNNNTCRFIASNNIQVELSDCNYAEEIHEVLKDAFGFPADYGKNWSAFQDYLDDFCGDRTSETTVHVDGLNRLSKDLRSYAEKMVEIMRRAEEQYPLVHFVLSKK